MGNSVTLFMCALFFLLFAVVGYMVASDWVRMVWQQIRFGKDFYGLFKADKQKWEKDKASRQEVGPTGAGDTDPSGHAE